SCTMWNHRDWQQLQDRKFYFNSFTYTHNGGSKVLAYSRMKEAPMRRILDLAEKKYSISIDSTEYDNFLVSGSPSLIKASGILMEKDFVWKGTKTGRNTVDMVLVVALDDLEFNGYNYQFILTTNGKTRAFAQGTVKKKEMVYPDLAKQLGADSASLSAIALTSAAALKNQSTAGPADSNSAPSYKSRQWAVEGKMKDQIDAYSRQLTPEDRKQFKDDMTRFINGSIK
nr:hypothetical protein [Spirochaetota bacterium]